MNLSNEVCTLEYCVVCVYVSVWGWVFAALSWHFDLFLFFLRSQNMGTSFCWQNGAVG